MTEPTHGFAVRIVPLSEHPHLADLVAGWVVAHWGKSTVAEFKQTLIATEHHPGAVIAMTNDAAIGMLSFSTYPIEDGDPHALWINALYVVAQWRGRGVGSQLLRAGMAAARRFGCERLHVYTDIPAYYEVHGWTRLPPKPGQEWVVLRWDAQE